MSKAFCRTRNQSPSILFPFHSVFQGSSINMKWFCFFFVNSLLGQPRQPFNQLNEIVNQLTLYPIPIIPPSMMGHATAPFSVPSSPATLHVGVQRPFVRRAIENGISSPDILVALLSTFCSMNPFVGPPAVNVKEELSYAYGIV